MGLLAALQFLTRVPLRLSAPRPHGQVVPWFPMAGAVIGGAVGLVAWAAGQIVSPLAAASLAVAFGLLITGAFHEDGLADVADAFGGGWTVEQRLAILKDSRHGTYGVAAIVTTILVRVVFLAELGDPVVMGLAAVATHALARSAAVAALVIVPPAVESGLGADVARSTGRPTLMVGAASGVVIAAFAVGWWVVAGAAAALLALGVVGRLAQAKIGGLAGDVLGAIEQVAECSVLVAFAMVAAVGPSSTDLLARWLF